MDQKKRVLSGRITKPLKQRLLDHMKANPALGGSQFSGFNSLKTQKEIWQTIAEDLNSVGPTNKTAKQWKKCWIDWKFAVKKQCSVKKNFNLNTPNLPSSSEHKKLDKLDEQVIPFLGIALEYEKLEETKSEAFNQMNILISKVDDLLEEQKKTNILLQQLIKKPN